MKKILLLSILLKTSAFAVICQTSSFTFGGMVRQYLIHVPAGYSPTVSIPLVIALHNAYGNASDFLHTTGFNTLADNKNFMVVYPKGTGNPSSWNAGGCCYSAMNNNVDDIGFISALIDTLKSKYSIDSSKVYARHLLIFHKGFRGIVSLVHVGKFSAGIWYFGRFWLFAYIILFTSAGKNAYY